MRLIPVGKGCVLLVALLAGCFGGADPSAQHDSSLDSVDHDQANGTVIAREPAIFPTTRLAATDCHGFFSSFDGLAPAYADEAPDQWRDDGLGPRHYGFVAYSCNRLGIGELERPGEIIFEFHTNARPPASCYEPYDQAHRIIRNVYMSDSEVAAEFAAITGTTVIVVNTTFVEEASGSLHQMRYAWTSEHGHSHFDVAYLESEEGTAPIDEVWLGFTARGPWRMDIRGASTGAVTDGLVGRGSVSEETLHAKLYGQTWAGTTLTYTKHDSVATITTFEDWECKVQRGS